MDKEIQKFYEKRLETIKKDMQNTLKELQTLANKLFKHNMKKKIPDPNDNKIVLNVYDAILQNDLEKLKEIREGYKKLMREQLGLKPETKGKPELPSFKI